MNPSDYIILAIRKDRELGATYDRLSKDKKQDIEARIDVAVSNYYSDNLPSVWNLIKIKAERFWNKITNS